MGVIRSRGLLLGLATASIVANVIIVVTGGAVRLSDSGLGCPTWPQCGDGSLTPRPEYAVHGIIEFSNRTLTGLLTAIAVATWLVAMIQRRQRPLATLALLGIPAQAVLGGLTVLTHLNPWLVGLHFLLSIAIIAVTVVLRHRLIAHRQPGPPGPLLLLQSWLTRAVVTVTAAVLVVGTIVTGAGPHAGDADTSGKVHRNGLNPGSMAQLHADLVMVLIGLSVGLVALLVATGSARRVGGTLLVLLGAQAGIGYAQYFLHVPPLLVGLHMLGACLVWLAALGVLLQAGDLQRLPDRVDRQPDQRAHHRAVDPHELQVTSHL